MRRFNPIYLFGFLGAILLFSCEQEISNKPNDTGRFVKFFGGTQTDEGFDAIELSGGGFAGVGSTESFGAGGSDVFLIITDENGNQLSDFITFGDTLDDIGRSIIEKPDGNFIIVGDFTDPTNGDVDIWFLEVNSMGMEVSSIEIGTPGFEERGYSVAATSDGGYILSGTKKPNSSTDIDSYVIKLDASGAIEWENDDALLNFTDNAASEIIETLDGDFVYSSTSQRDSSALLTDMRLTSLNGIGQPNWNFFFGENNRNEIASSVAGGSGTIYSVGSSVDPGSGNSDVYLIRTTTSGTQLGEVITLDFGDTDLGKAVGELRDGNIAVASESFTTVLNGNDIFLTKVNGFGDQLWDQPLIIGGEGDDIASKVFEASDGGVVVFGTISFSGNPMMLLFKTDKNGNLAE